MDLHLLLDNLTNPALLFFFLGVGAVMLKSDLEIPPSSSKFISLYLLFAIGFKGGQELSHSEFSTEMAYALLLGVVLALVVPVYGFFILKKRLGTANAGAIAAAYGSVSAVTFVTAVSYLEVQHIPFSGYMVAVMALMEAPSIIVGVFLLSLFGGLAATNASWRKLLHHALTNGSVLLILGSLLIGYLASPEQAQGIKPFTSDIFKGFLAVFLLDMGIISGKKLNSFLQAGWFPVAYALLMPLFNGCVVAWGSQFITAEPGNRFLFAILAASASYIAVPAAMKMAAPQANPGLYIPMALAVTFPFNITLGMPLYMSIILLS